MLCGKHGIEMVNGYRRRPNRCPKCTADFRAKLATALSYYRHPGRCDRRQRILPPVIMSERWP